VDILARPADLSRPPATLLGGVNRRYPAGWSSDDGRLLFQETSLASGNDIRLLTEPGTLPVGSRGDTCRRAQRAALSARRLGSVPSNETGRFEVYVRPVGRPGGAIPISTGGGGDPVWSRDGRELFYLEGNDLKVVTVRTQPTFEASAPLKLFSGNFNSGNLAGANYDVTVDGRRFVMVAHTQPDRSMPINLVTNWWEELKRLAPPK
jgi:eukaryotic-like serine/threonine-protein kinase